VTTIPPPTCWLHEDVVVEFSPIEGRGLFARVPIPAGTVVMKLGGKLVTRAELDRMFAEGESDPDAEYIDSMSVDDGIDLVMAPGQDVHFGNHSCDPNIWHVDAYTLAARRDIAEDEEVVLDYGTQTDYPSFTMECTCGSTLCRGTVSGADWQRADLQERYGDHWVPVLLERIRGSSER
jgi:uncharacterized protein